LDISQLKVFCSVAREGSISQAAKVLHRVPSNISTRLKQLENELGTDLFIREKLRLHLSEQGKIFLEYAEKVLMTLDEAREAVVSSEPKGSFSLGSILSTAAVRAPDILAAYHQRYPHVELDFSTGASDDMVNGLLEGRLTAAFIDGPIPHPLLEGMPLWKEQMMVVAAKNHPPITCAKDVAGAQLYAFRRVCSYRRYFESWFEAENVRPGKISEMESYHGMLGCVSAGAGLALAPQSILATIPGAQHNLSIWPLKGNFQSTQIWLWWKKNTRSANLQALQSLLQERGHG